MALDLLFFFVRQLKMQIRTVRLKSLAIGLVTLNDMVSLSLIKRVIDE